MSESFEPRQSSSGVSPRADFVARTKEVSAAQASPLSADMERLTLLLDESMRELLASFGIADVHAELAHDGSGNAPCLAAFIGFGSEVLRGAVTVVAPVPLIERTCPLCPTPPPLNDADAADWCCEIVNQLTGRLKNKLLRRGVALQISAPQGLLADRIRLSRSAHGGLIARSYRIEDCDLIVCLDLAVSESAPLFQNDATLRDDIPTEGDLIIL